MADVEALPGVCAVLTLTDGSRVTVGLSDLPSLTPPSPEDVGLLIRWDNGPEPSGVYRVPAAMAGRVAWALGCRPDTAPRLMEVRPELNTVTFTALQHERCAYTLTVLRWACVRLGRPLPRFAGMPVELTITDEQRGRHAQGLEASRMFSFEVYPETPEGAACLEALGLMVSPPDGEE
ncbi:hypothetical protein [Deinococcus altitudinis]|uniref:hypothetical protein n=1 Tax=Deinococcus altitudinis TaxID=468914 RepID=UPI0038925407